MERKILIGIPVMGVTEDIKVNDNGNIEDVDISRCEDDIWCDFSVEYYEDDKEKYYYLSFETCLGFDTKEGCRNWIITCLNTFTDYMKSHNYDLSKELDMHQVFTEGLNVNSHFETIEDAFAFVKLMVHGFHGSPLFCMNDASLLKPLV